jgi:hypothetical protein
MRWWKRSKKPNTVGEEKIEVALQRIRSTPSSGMSRERSRLIFILIIVLPDCEPHLNR